MKTIIKNSKIYEKLLNVEKEIDEQMYKTRLDIQENLIMPTPKVKALLRTQIYSKFKSEEEEDYWVLRLQGKIMPIQDNEGGFYRKFSYFFHKIQIKFDPINEEEFQDIEWTRSTNNDIDGFEIKRSGKTSLKIKIVFWINSYTQEYKLSDELAELLGVSQDTRPRILHQIWQYIKINSLQDLENPNIILNNKELQSIFKCERMDITSITSRIGDHLKAPEPIEIDFIIKDENTQLYDIAVSIDDPHFLDISNFLSNIENESILFPKSLFFHKSDSQKNDKFQQTYTERFYSKIQDYDRNVTDLIEKLKKHKYKYDFYEMYAKDPTKFINNFLIQQNALLKIMKDESSVIDARWDYNSAQYYKDYEVKYVNFRIF
jgi:SWI/SNF-related matrix-associated actin-dependent regulator of chromatin subfamily D